MGSDPGLAGLLHHDPVLGGHGPVELGAVVQQVELLQVQRAVLVVGQGEEERRSSLRT
jgi:hypothetical protein